MDTYKSSVMSLVERAEALGWSCYVDSDGFGIEFSQYSPAGEDFGFFACGETVDEIVKDIRCYAEDFDIEEHVKMWLDAKVNGTGGVPGLVELVSDASFIQKALNELAWDDKLCGNKRSTLKKTTLRERIEKNKAWHIKHYGGLNWNWEDEGLPNAISDYHSGVGSVLNFTEDDWRACMENGYSLDEVCDLCDEREFQSDVNSLSDFFSYFPNDRSEDDAICDVKDFYKWRTELLPIAEKVYRVG